MVRAGASNTSAAMAGNERFILHERAVPLPADVLASALDGGKIPSEAPPASPKTVQEPGPVSNPAPVHTLRFEQLAAGSYSIGWAKIPGGWLVSNGATGPDQEHSWNGESI